MVRYQLLTIRLLTDEQLCFCWHHDSLAPDLPGLLSYGLLLYSSELKMMLNCYRYFLAGILIIAVTWEIRTCSFGGASFNLNSRFWVRVIVLRHAVFYPYLLFQTLNCYGRMSFKTLFFVFVHFIRRLFTLCLHIFRIEFITASVAGYAPSRRLLSYLTNSINAIIISKFFAAANNWQTFVSVRDPHR